MDAARRTTIRRVAILFGVLSLAGCGPAKLPFAVDGVHPLGDRTDIENRLTRALGLVPDRPKVPTVPGFNRLGEWSEFWFQGGMNQGAGARQVIAVATRHGRVVALGSLWNANTPGEIRRLMASYKRLAAEGAPGLSASLYEVLTTNDTLVVKLVRP